MSITIHYQCTQLNLLAECGYLSGYDRFGELRQFKSKNGLNIATSVFLTIPVLTKDSRKQSFKSYEMKNCIDCGEELITATVD